MKYKHPRIKPIYPLYQLNKKQFRVGAQLGITTEFDDEEALREKELKEKHGVHGAVRISYKTINVIIQRRLKEFGSALLLRDDMFNICVNIAEKYNSIVRPITSVLKTFRAYAEKSLTALRFTHLSKRDVQDEHRI